MLLSWYYHAILMVSPLCSHCVVTVFHWYSNCIPIVLSWYSHRIITLFKLYSHAILIVLLLGRGPHPWRAAREKMETRPPAAVATGRGRSIERSSGVRPHESQRGQASVVFAHGAREIRSTNRMSFIGPASMCYFKTRKARRNAAAML